MIGDISRWFGTLPLLSRQWFGGTVLLTLLGYVGILSLEWVLLDSYSLFSRFQIWRPVSALLCYPLSPRNGLHFLFNLYHLYFYSTKLETTHFGGRTADYLFMLLFCWLCNVVASLMMGLYSLMDQMVMSVLYVWCQINRDVIIGFWFGTRFKAMYYPWVLLIFYTITQGRWLYELMGIAVGHLYFFLTFKYPLEFGGATLLHTPQFLYDFFPNQRQTGAGFGSVSPPASGARDRNQGAGGGGGGGGGGFNVFRGQGHRLG
ncbi:hypothetical protein Pcinc_037897 [Petrolisthes cinctipes]|uniref:Derlin n=1 Tax=Petrolisthes cinctipes TaxID=88211 RepID=A0AAE1EKK0_PETCI|nr:hypothetical protein Pcinc_037897 [Petrolisthes cinctipes]